MSNKAYIKKVEFPHAIIQEILEYNKKNMNNYDFNRLNVFDSSDKIGEVLGDYKLIVQSMRQVNKNILNILLDHILILLKLNIITEDMIHPKHMRMIHPKYQKLNIINDTIKTKTVINYYHIQYFYLLVTKYIKELLSLIKYLKTLKCDINNQISIFEKITIINNEIPNINKYIAKLNIRLSDMEAILNLIN